jgi:hypothetical protein
MKAQCKRGHLRTPDNLDIKSSCVACLKLKRTERQRNLKEESGGKCALCGYDKCFQALEFHHLDPKTKSFGLTASRRKDIEKTHEEVKKCILLCANCHREVEYGLTVTPVAGK